MKKVIIFSIMFCILSIHSQAQSWLWAQSAGGAGTDIGYGIANDNSGNIYVTGHFESPTITFGNITLTNTGNGNIFIAKYSASGNAIWAHNVVGSDFDYGVSITTDAASSVYIAGYFQSPTLHFGSTILTNVNPPSKDIFIAKYDSAGNFIWAHSAGGLNHDYAVSITADAACNVFVTGYFVSDSIAFGSNVIHNTNSCTDSVTSFIAKYDSAGNVLWAKGTSGCVFSECVATDSFGHEYMTGFFEYTNCTIGSTVLTNTGTLNIFIAKYDESGNVIWALTPQGDGFNQAQGIATDAAGNLYITGSFKDTIYFGNTFLTSTARNIFIAKYDSSGNSIWAKNPYGVGPDAGYSLTTDAAANVYFTGSFASPSLHFNNTVLNNAGLSNIFLAKYDSSSNLLWATRIGGANYDYGYGVVTDLNSNVCIDGAFGSDTIAFDDFELINAGNLDFYVAKYGTIVTGVDFITNTTDKLMASPNPNNGTFNLSYHLSSSSNILYIYDVMGRMVYSTTINGNSGKETIDVSNLTNGIYFYQLINDKETLQGKFVISN